MIRIGIILFLALVRLFSCSEPNKRSNPSLTEKATQSKPESMIQFKLYANSVNIKIKGDPATSAIVFISLHDDETTAQEVVSSYLKENHAAFIRIENNKQRLIRFSYLKESYVFDPNRMFTNKGRRLTLGLHGAYSDSAAAKVNEFASLVLQQLSTAKTVVAVHNNSNGKFSILSYLKGGEFFKNAKQVYKNPASDPDDLFLTTSPQLFERLKTKGFNIVLQDNVNVADNGSLSFYHRNINKRYVNIEAQDGHFAKQLEMLQALVSVLEPSSLRKPVLAQ